MKIFNNKAFKSITIPLFLLIIFWLIKIVEVSLNTDFVFLGTFPRKITGLTGIIFSPFLHGDLKHLLSNSVPFLVLLTTLYYFYKSIATKILIISWFIIGVGVWLLARESYHIGASGLIYALFSFLVLSGIYRKQKALLAISLLTIFLYGSLIWGILPQELNVSWESHLLGLIVGGGLAIYYRKDRVDVIRDNLVLEEFHYKEEFWNDVIEE